MVGLELRISERRTHDDSTPFALQSPFCVFFRLSSRATPESLKKGANIGRQCFRLFHGSEVSPAAEFSPVLNVVAALDPSARRHDTLPCWVEVL